MASGITLKNLKRETFHTMQKELKQTGEAKYEDLTINDLSVAHDSDLSEFMPIYFNWEANKDLDPSQVPSYVICYEGPEEGSFCFRPVEGEKSETIVDEYERGWKLRESMVRVSSDDTYLQEEMIKIGYLPLAEGQEGLEAGPGAVMMGRQELTPQDKPGRASRDRD